jgi:hypothetical protein
LSAKPAKDSLPAGSFARLFAGLGGDWRLEKTFSDGSAFAGTARFKPAGEAQFLLEEDGVLTLARGGAVKAFRHWRWVLEANGGLIIAYPTESGGATYHRFLPQRQAGGWSGFASHPCGADIYEAGYLLHDGAILIDHRVKGPRKDYRIEARFIR